MRLRKLPEPVLKLPAFVAAEGWGAYLWFIPAGERRRRERGSLADQHATIREKVRRDALAAPETKEGG